jgi:hypothetical protein
VSVRLAIPIDHHQRPALMVAGHLFYDGQAVTWSYGLSPAVGARGGLSTAGSQRSREGEGRGWLPRA